jgi:hypothetical protein
MLVVLVRLPSTGARLSAQKGQIILEKEEADAFRDVSPADRQQWRAVPGTISKVVLRAPSPQPLPGDSVHVSYPAATTPAPHLPWRRAINYSSPGALITR